MANVQIAQPPKAILEAYHSIAKPWMQSVGARELANRDLAKTRDTLLPKLLSGDLRLPATQSKQEVAV